MCIFIECKKRLKSSTSVLERTWVREQHVHYLKSVDDRMHVLIVLMTIAIISRIHPCSLVFMLGLKRVFCGEESSIEDITITSRITYYFFSKNNNNNNHSTHTNTYTAYGFVECLCTFQLTSYLTPFKTKRRRATYASVGVRRAQGSLAICSISQLWPRLRDSSLKI